MTDTQTYGILHPQPLDMPESSWAPLWAQLGVEVWVAPEPSGLKVSAKGGRSAFRALVTRT
jgi:hypothetical protein